jgi:hypothetical protein
MIADTRDSAARRQNAPGRAIGISAGLWHPRCELREARGDYTSTLMSNSLSSATA